MTVKEYKRKYYLENREKYLDRAREREDKFPEEIKKTRRNYYQQNRDRLLVYNKEYREKNKEILALKRKMKKENK